MRRLLPLAFLLAPSLAAAQIAEVPQAPELDAQRYRPTMDSRKTLWTESAGVNQRDFVGVGRLFFHYANAPLVWVDPTDDTNVVKIVSDALALDVVGAVSYNRFRLGVDFASIEDPALKTPYAVRVPGAVDVEPPIHRAVQLPVRAVRRHPTRVRVRLPRPAAFPRLRFVSVPLERGVPVLADLAQGSRDALVPFKWVFPSVVVDCPRRTRRVAAACRPRSHDRRSVRWIACDVYRADRRRRGRFARTSSGSGRCRGYPIDI